MSTRKANAMCALFLVLFAVCSGCGSAHYRHLPVASAVIVHACAAAEARAHMEDDAIEKTTIHLEVGGQVSASGEANAGVDPANSTFGLSAVKTTAKAVDVELKTLPSMQQCGRWGYTPQLGSNGCLIGTTANGKKCEVASSLPSDPPIDRQARAAAATVMSK